MAAPAASAPRRNARYTPLNADGPLPLDMVRAVPAIRRDPLAFLRSCVERHGDLVAFPMPRGAVLLVNDPDGARRVLQDNHRAYGKATVQYRSLSLVTGDGLLTTDGAVWRRHRRIAQPAFHHEALPAVAQVASRAAGALQARWAAAPGRVLDADAALMRTMLEVVGRTLFAADVGEVGERVVRAVDDALHVVVSRARSPVPAWLPTPARRRLRRANATLDALCAELIGARTASGVGSADADVLALLLRAAAPGDGAIALQHRELRDEIVTMVIAGHETVASSLTWTLHLLAGAADVQDRMHAELDAVLGSAARSREPGWDDLRRLPWTRAVVDEALRLYPPAWVITRRALETDEVCGVRVPAGALVIVSPWLLGRRAASWPDPDRFDPERFVGAGRAVRGDYVPFGAGPRLCIGRDVALVEAVLLLAGLLRRHRVRPVRDGAPAVDALVTLRPRGGLPLRLDPR